MNPQINIVISGVDQFSAVFARLDAALATARDQGTGLGAATEAVTAGMAGLAAGTAKAGGQVERLSATLADQLARTAEQHGETLALLQAQQETAAVAGQERLLALNLDGQTRRLEQREQGQAAAEQSLQSHYARLEQITRTATARLAAFESAQLQARLERFTFFTHAIQALAASQGQAMAQTAKSLAVANALIDTYVAANAALAAVPYPLNFAAAALVTARGLQNVRQIEQTPIAHGGLEQVPEDATFLLRRGERVLSPRQNRDLTSFLEDRGGTPGAGGVVIQELTIHVLENATHGDALLSMSPTEMQQVVAEKIVPALNALARLGIKPQTDE